MHCHFICALRAARTIKVELCVSCCDANPVSFAGGSCYTADGYDWPASLGEMCDSFLTSFFFLSFFLCLCLCVDWVTMTGVLQWGGVDCLTWSAAFCFFFYLIINFRCVPKDLPPFAVSIRGPGHCVQLGWKWTQNAKYELGHKFWNFNCKVVRKKYQNLIVKIKCTLCTL